MPDLMDRLYCSEQIHIPPTFPYIMKLYCKAAIRTQPYDLLKWSAAYFRALANGEEPPVKERVEYPPYDSPSGLTPGYIKILINQFGKNPSTTVTAQDLFKKWSDICLDEYLLVKLIALLGANTVVNWVRFIGVCAGFISKTLTQTMILICELFTEEPEGGMATIPYELFVDLYSFLAQMECGPLTEEEQDKLDAIMYEEDVCEVADKIKQGIYEAEAEGEMMFEEEAEAEAEGTVEEEAESEKERIGEEEQTFRKGLEEESVTHEEETKEERQEERRAQKEAEEKTKEELRKDSEEFESEYGKSSAKSSLSEERSQKSKGSEEGESLSSTAGERSPKLESKISVYEKEEEADEVVIQEKPKEDEAKEHKRILLEDLEDSIREKIEEKLAEEEESLLDEEEKEFQDLNSYLLGAAARVQKFTAETLGFKIFKRFLRQEVPGIGPCIDSDQVEKIIDFMDSWAHKQELMVMPRNIRHWMCPPLDKVPTPQP